MAESQTHNDDASPLYGRPYKCFVCGNLAVTLFAIETQAELDAVRSTFLRSVKIDRGIGVWSNETRDRKNDFL